MRDLFVKLGTLVINNGVKVKGTQTVSALLELELPRSLHNVLI